ncbi:sensor histidine kinase [Streptomyces sp. NPDC058171]
MNTAVRGGLKLVTGLALGACTAVVELVFVVLAGLILLPLRAWPRGHHTVLRPVHRIGRRFVAWERARLAAYQRTRLPPLYGAPDGDDRALRYIAARWPLGLLGGAVLGCLVLGLGYGVFLIFGWIVMEVRHPDDVMLSVIGGLLLLFLAVQGVLGVTMLERRLIAHLLGPSPEEALRRRIDELFASRAGVVDAVHDERRRIERDLHDGVQQRLVALGMLLGRARRGDDPDRTSVLLRQAHEESHRALVDLREVAWRVYPAALDEAGLEAALSTVVDRSEIPVLLGYHVMRPPPKAVAAVAYFVVAEAVTNTVKHAKATKIVVMIGEEEGDRLYVTIEDDGQGGAVPEGGGLTGLARRVAALDGTFEVRSPPGGPTKITVELPCV